MSWHGLTCCQRRKPPTTSGAAVAAAETRPHRWRFGQGLRTPCRL